MATVDHYKYDYLDQAGFQPGQSRYWLYGPWEPWAGKAVVATAQPFPASGQNRTLTTDVEFRTQNGERYLFVTVRNVGQDTIIIYYIMLGVIGA